jgi:hypothetical protein
VPVIPRASDRIQYAGHQNVVDVPPAEEEFLTQDSLDREAARLIEPAGRDIATKNTQRQLACAPAAGLLDGLVQLEAELAVGGGGRPQCDGPSSVSVPLA